MKITFKRFTYSERMSEETYCFNAIVCLDGVACFEASNRGTGGADEYRPLQCTQESREKMGAAMQRLVAHARTLPDAMEHDMLNVELVIAEAVTDELERRAKQKFVRDLGRYVFMAEKGKLYRLPVRQPEHISALVADVERKHPGSTVLNALDADKAWKFAQPVLFPRQQQVPA